MGLGALELIADCPDPMNTTTRIVTAETFIAVREDQLEWTQRFRELALPPCCLGCKVRIGHRVVGRERRVHSCKLVKLLSTRRTLAFFKSNGNSRSFAVQRAPDKLQSI